MSKLKFTEADHKYWVSNLYDSDNNPVFTISTDYRNKYLKPEDRGKKPLYKLHIWEGENLDSTEDFKFLKDAINHAKIIKI